MGEKGARVRSRLTPLIAVLVAAFSVIGCSDGSTEPETSEPAVPQPPSTTTTTVAATTSARAPTTTGAGSEVTLTADIQFAAGAPDLAEWSDPLFDVYAPGAGRDLPLVVILPPHSLTKEDAASIQLANALAEQGVVAVVANWSQLAEPVGSFQDPAVLTEVLRAGQSFAGCAVSVVASRAGEFGADPSRLVLVGELQGANVASRLALGTQDPFPGCAATVPSWSAAGLVGLNGDWLVAFPLFDPVAAAAVESLSPWPLLDTAPEISTVFAVTIDAVDQTQRCDETNAWLTPRDVSGSMRAQLDAIGATEDGCVDFGDQADATASEMSSRGFEVEVIRLPNSDNATRTISGAHVAEFGPADIAALLSAIMTVAE